MQASKSFELAVELEIPEDWKQRLPTNGHQQARYELALGEAADGELAILGENLWLKPAGGQPERQRELFPRPLQAREQLLLREGMHSNAGWRKVLTKKTESGNDYFLSETSAWKNLFRLGPHRLALANLPEDEERFPVATWVKRVLMEGVDSLVLSSEAMRRPSPPGSPTAFQPDGSNLPWVVDALRASHPMRFAQWVAHVQTALPDIQDIDTVIREEDRNRYLCIQYRNGLRAPSWTVSDGTLRLLALTLLAYASVPGAIYLVEEPENGIHPQAVETVSSRSRPPVIARSSAPPTRRSCYPSPRLPTCSALPARRRAPPISCGAASIRRSGTGSARPTWAHSSPAGCWGEPGF